ncbi:MAG: hypothetical protein V3S24_04590 [Candidatus Tectomicrobia bacterium]
MSLQQQLDEVRAKSGGRIPADKRAIMEQATEELRQSGMANRSLDIGDTMPAFELSNATGTTVRSADLLARGPLVVNFYRGGW